MMHGQKTIKLKILVSQRDVIKEIPYSRPTNIKVHLGDLEPGVCTPLRQRIPKRTSRAFDTGDQHASVPTVRYLSEFYRNTS
jgi:hypothetical protein